MAQMIDTRNPRAVQAQTDAVYREMFLSADAAFVERAFGWAIQCFTGNHADYRAIDARYHDLEHTLQGTLCLVRLLLGRQRAHGQPALSQSMFETCLVAMLFHDTGYLKKHSDTEGTGAKYTAVHVTRSAHFAREFLHQHGFPAEQTTAVQHMISCTGVHTDLDRIPFSGEEERCAGYALGTADLLGQMAAPDYVEKLDVLYLEFAEAARFSPEWGSRFANFKSAEDLIQNTPAFWQNYVLPHLQRDFGSLYKYLNDPYPDGTNSYLLQVEQNMERIRGRMHS